jgi:hypothetical protein
VLYCVVQAPAVVTELTRFEYGDEVRGHIFESEFYQKNIKMTSTFVFTRDLSCNRFISCDASPDQELHPRVVDKMRVG